MPDDKELKTELARLFRRPRPTPLPATIEVRLASLEKKLDTIETRQWALITLVAGAELVRLIVGR